MAMAWDPLWDHVPGSTVPSMGASLGQPAVFPQQLPVWASLTGTQGEWERDSGRQRGGSCGPHFTEANLQEQIVRSPA